MDGNHAVWVYQTSGLSLVQSTFDNNTLFPSSEGAALIQLEVQSSDTDNTEARLQEVTFINNSPSTIPILLAHKYLTAAGEAVFYSDSSQTSVCTYDDPDPLLREPVSAADIAAGICPCNLLRPRLLVASGSRFLTADDPWFKKVQQVGVSRHSFTSELCESLNFAGSKYLQRF